MNWRDDLNNLVPAGSVQLIPPSETSPGVHHLCFVCPCGCGELHIIAMKKGGGYGWEWDGNEQDPTLTPSIQATTGCRWHGYLKKGKWEKA